MQPSYTYAATVVRVVDGDTIDVDLDYGDRLHAVRRLRIAHIDAPEHNTEAGRRASAFVCGLLPVGTDIVVTTSKPDKYGRQLAAVHLLDGTDLAERLLAADLAVPYEGGTKGVRGA